MQTPQQKLLLYKEPIAVLAVSFLCLRLFAYYVASNHLENHNLGLAFGYGEGASALVIAGSILLCWIAAFLISKKYFLIPIALVLAGSASNIVDRLETGGVKDFVIIGSWVGNPADIVIGIGIVWIVWGMIRGNASSH